MHDAAHRLAGGSAAFQNYVSGDVLVGRAMNNLLKLLDRDPRLLDAIEEGTSAAE